MLKMFERIFSYCGTFIFPKYFLSKNCHGNNIQSCFCLNLSFPWLQMYLQAEVALRRRAARRVQPASPRAGCHGDVRPDRLLSARTKWRPLLVPALHRVPTHPAPPLSTTRRTQGRGLTLVHSVNTMLLLEMFLNVKFSFIKFLNG